MDDLLERLKSQIYKHCMDKSITIELYDLIELVQEYEIETGRRKRWDDERWD